MAKPSHVGQLVEAELIFVWSVTIASLSESKGFVTEAIYNVNYGFPF